MPRQFDLLVVGHFAMDKIELKEGIQILRLGGSAFYSSIAASRLGARVAVLSKVGKDFPQKYLEILEHEGIDTSFIQIIENAETTSFHIKYQGNRRKMKLQALGPKILAEDAPISIKTRVVHIAPIANEIPLETFEKLQKIANVICLDPQGYVREFDSEGSVRLKEWQNESFLRKISIFKSNVEEAICVAGFSDLRKAIQKIAGYGVGTVIVTMGEKGATLFHNNNFHKIHVHPVNKVVDPTGAGDVFIGAYLAEYIKGKNPVWCACVGSAAASFIIEKAGLLRFGDEKEIYERARGLYRRI